jgi:O-antigen/teichoic acid export membrane protein
LNTAWTINIFRNSVLWVVLCALAFPAASFYGQPIISRVLPVAGLTGVIASFSSTNMALADRNLQVARNTLLNLGSYLIGIATTIVVALVDHSIWSLIVGNLLGTASRTLGSHLLLDGISNRFAWDRKSILAMAGFGRWIFVGSALTFFVGEGTRLLIGTLLPVATLAFLNLAISMAQLPLQIVQQLGNKVFFPAYSEVVRERPERIYIVLAKARLVQIVPHWLISAFFVYFGSSLMALLYDRRYEDSGWMLQLLALGWLAGCIVSSYNGILFAKGSSHLNTIQLSSQLIIQVICIYVGYDIAGTEGLVIGFSVALWIIYPVNAFLLSRLNLWQPSIDLPFLGLSILVVASFMTRLAHQ